MSATARRSRREGATSSSRTTDCKTSRCSTSKPIWMRHRRSFWTPTSCRRTGRSRSARSLFRRTGSGWSTLHRPAARTGASSSFATWRPAATWATTSGGSSSRELPGRTTEAASFTAATQSPRRGRRTKRRTAIRSCTTTGSGRRRPKTGSSTSGRTSRSGALGSRSRTTAATGSWVCGTAPTSAIASIISTWVTRSRRDSTARWFGCSMISTPAIRSSATTGRCSTS